MEATRKQYASIIFGIGLVLMGGFVIVGQLFLPSSQQNYPVIPKDLTIVQPCGDERIGMDKQGVYWLPIGLLNKLMTNSNELFSLGWLRWTRKPIQGKRRIRLRELPCPGLLRGIGLEEKDILIQINKIPIRAFIRSIQPWKRLKLTGEAYLVIKRDGEILTLHYRIGYVKKHG